MLYRSELLIKKVFKYDVKLNTVVAQKCGNKGIYQLLTFKTDLMKNVRMTQNAIFSKYYLLAKMVARQFFKNEDDIENAASVALERIFIKFRNADLVLLDKNAGYVYRMIKNTCISERRKLNTVFKNTFQVEDFSAFDREIECSGFTEDDERFVQVKKEIAQLSEREQKVISLKFYDGLTYDEIADELGENPKNMGTLYSRTINKLRAKVA